MTVYDSGPGGPNHAIVEEVPGWQHSGCYTDASDRTLGSQQPTSTEMTASRCASLCGGSMYFGVENGNECFMTLKSTNTNAYSHVTLRHV